MPLDFTSQKYYFNRCNQNESLAPDDERNLDIDSWGEVPVRGDNWVQRLARRIELSETPTFVMFTGLPGSGKSTELRRLARRLEQKGEGCANLLTVLVDAEEVLDLANPVDVPDIIMSILLVSEERLLYEEGKHPKDAVAESYATRLWNWLTMTDVELGKAEYSIPGGPKLVAEMKTRPSLRSKVRKAIGAYLSSFLGEAKQELTLFNERARRLGFEGLAVIYDSLEKLRGISTNWTEVLSSAERIFAGGAPYLRLPVHVLYTVPPALVARRVEEVQFLPMIKLRTQEGTLWDPGFRAARELVRKRIPDNALVEILGSQAEQRMRELIRWSGGYPRELIRMLRSVLAIPNQPVSAGDFERVVNELCDSYRKIIPADAFPWLAQVARDQYVTNRDEEHRRIVDLMLSNSAVLRYVNDKDWFDLHPAVEQIPGVQEAKKALRNPSDPE